jgi:hypothetical protein
MESEKWGKFSNVLLSLFYCAFQQLTSLSQFLAPLFSLLVFNKIACAID